MSTVVIMSGGLDSTVLAHWVLREYQEPVYLVSFDYGQKHRKELEHAQVIAQLLQLAYGPEKVFWQLVDLTAVGALLNNSSLTSDTAVPDGHYREETMRITVVPNRNAIMLAIGFGFANSLGAKRVCTAVHGGDHYIYPDCRPEFIEAFSRMEEMALADMKCPELITPFVNMSKADIVSIGRHLGVPFERTWSCYKGGQVHCGSCGTCFERREAFMLAGVNDPTTYEHLPMYEDPTQCPS